MLKELFQDIEYQLIQKEYNGAYNKIEYNSLSIEVGDIFVALVGNKVDGHKYIKNAVENGAKLIVVSKDIEEIYENINIIKVENTRKMLGKLASNFYEQPEKKLKFIGVTGTNGKTTTAYLIHKFIKNSAFIGSIGVEISDERFLPTNTTPESLDIIKYAKLAVEKGLEYMVLEVSSQGIDNWRIENLEFIGGIFTNLTKEHLDYHKTMEEYFVVKERLFKQVIPTGFIITNTEDEYGKRIKEKYPKAITYAFTNADYNGKILDMGIEKMNVLINVKNVVYNLETSLIGEYNLLNIMAGMAMVEALGLRDIPYNELLKDLSFVEGRMQIVEKNGIKIVIDYAHTEDALEKVLKTLSLCKKRKLYTLVSGTGERYKEKRTVLGEIAGKYSDYVIISSNSPRYEDPMEIAQEVAKGLENKCYKHYEIYVDRVEAVKKIISLAKEGDIIILTGKGHERYQEIKGDKTPYYELEVVKNSLNINI